MCNDVGVVAVAIGRGKMEAYSDAAGVGGGFGVGDVGNAC